jgi:hypothetical protein
MVHGRSSAIQSQWTKIPGGTIHYRAVSAAADEFPVVFLIHGLIVSSRYMVPTAERLAPFCRVYAPDLPGYGKSYKPGKVLTLSELADALADWMDALEMANAHLVGNSFGIKSTGNRLRRYMRDRARIDLIVYPAQAAADLCTGATLSRFFRLFWPRVPVRSRYLVAEMLIPKRLRKRV